MDTIVVKNLDVTIKKNKILEKVSFSIPENKISIFVGENGAGKTTTIKCILGLQTFDNGQIKIFDRNSTNSNSRANVAYVPDKENFDIGTPRQWIIEQNMFYGIDKNVLNERINKLAIDFSFPFNKLDVNLTKLSSGLKKIIMIINALASERKLIIMDEPTEYLDPLMRNNFFRIVHSYIKKGLTFFISTHNLDEIEKYADHWTVIKDHKIVYSDTYQQSSISMRELYELFYQTNDPKVFDKKDAVNIDPKVKYKKMLDKNIINKQEYELLLTTCK